MPTTPLRDIVMYYEDHGSGDPLVLIMGLGGDLQAWAQQVPVLSRHFRVITFDNRGAGRTSAPDRPYSIATMADDVAALLDELNIPKAHILGFSMGGYIAQEFVLRYPGRVDRLVLLATAPAIDGYGRNVVKGWIDVRRSNLSREQVIRLSSTWLYSAELMNDPDRFERSVLNSLNNPYAQQDHAFIRQAQAVLAFDARDRLASVKAATLILAGNEDILVPPRNSEALAKLIPGAKLQVLSGAHLGCLEFPGEYNAAVLDHLGAAVSA